MSEAQERDTWRLAWRTTTCSEWGEKASYEFIGIRKNAKGITK